MRAAGAGVRSATYSHSPSHSVGSAGSSSSTAGLGITIAERLSVRREIYRSEHTLKSGLQLERIRIVEAQFHYPLVRFDEQLRHDPASGRDQVLQSEAMVADHLLAKLNPDETVANATALAAGAGFKVGRVVDAGRILLLNFDASAGDPLPDKLAQLRAASWVEHAEPDYLVATCETADDPSFVNGFQWGLTAIDAPNAWSIRTDASDTVVAIVDTGVRLTHEDLAANLWINPGETGGGRETNGIDDDGDGFVDDVHGINAITGSGIPDDDYGHGTHVAGIVGAAGNNGKGIAGVAWHVQLMALKFLDSSGVGTDSDAVVCIDYAREKGAYVINASWGGSGDSQIVREAIEACSAAGMIFVAAAGNSGSDLNYFDFWPGGYDLPGMLSVASLEPDGSLSPFSNYGPVQIAAPGSAIYSAWYETDTSYKVLSGTSMAAPHVTGTIALLHSQFPSETNTQIINRVIAGGKPSSQLATHVAYGRSLDVYDSIRQPTLPSVPVLTVPGPETVEIGDSANLTVTVAGDAPFTYQWQHYGTPIPGAIGPTLTLTNIQPAQRGDYSVVVTNAAASVYSRPISVAVVGPPSIVTQPVAQQAIAGNNATFSVTALANGASNLQFQWYLNGAAITGATNATLDLHGVQVSQAGSYRVIVSSEYGSVTSSNALLTVTPAQAPIVTSQPQDVTLTADETAGFNVTVNGTPDLQFQWLKDGAVLPGATAQSLLIERAQQADAGAYSVVITNSGGSTTSRAAQLFVQFAPVAPFVVQAPLDRSAYVGDTAVFTASVKGTPTPDFQWWHDGTAIAGATGLTLTLSDITADSAGAYTLTATNASGSVTVGPVNLKIASGLGQQRWEWRNPLPQGNSYYDVTQFAGTLIAVGGNGSISTSPDALSWTLRSSGTQETLVSIASDSNHVVAVGRNGTITESDDGGQTWSVRYSSTSVFLYGVTHGGGQFVAVGENGVILTSSDTVNWKLQTSPTTATLGSITFGNGYFMIGGWNGQVLRSADGINWTAYSVGHRVDTITYGNGIFVAGCTSGGGGVIASSPDGIAWTDRYHSESFFARAAYVRDNFVVLGSNHEILVSPDGLDWASYNDSFGNLPEGIIYLEKTFVIVGEFGAVHTSPDLINWTTQLGDIWAEVLSVVYGPKGYVAVGVGTSRYSSTGILWSTTASGVLRNKVVYLNGQYIAVGASFVDTSTDGRQWTTRSVPGAFNLRSIAYGASLYVCVDDAGALFTSPDLMNWTQRTSPVTAGLTDVAYSGVLFVAAGREGTILTSVNGITWTARTSGLENANWRDLFGVATNGQRWVAVGPLDAILTSTNGHTWSIVPRRGQQAVNSVIFAANNYIAVSSDATVLTSSDGLTWNEIPTNTSNILEGVCAGPDSLIVCGQGDTIIQSEGLFPGQRTLVPTPARQAVLAGQPADLSVAGAGGSELNYQWARDGIAIPDATAPTFHVSSTQSADAGIYTAVVRNGADTTTSYPAYLAVVNQPSFATNLGADGGPGTIGISAPDGLNWSAGTITGWLTFTGATSGAGNGEVSFSISPNTTGIERHGSIVIAGRSVAIDQPGLSITTQPQSSASGGTATFLAAASSGPEPSFQWLRNGRVLTGATGAQLTLADLQPGDTGIYSATIANGFSTGVTQPAILGLLSNQEILGDGSLVGSGIRHPNGNFYDQVLLQGPAASITAAPGKVTRISYVDLDDDIVQVEFAGAGTLSLVLDGPSGPAAPLNYHQPDVAYMKGHAGIVIAGADETTNVSVFTIGRATAFDPTGTFSFLLPISAANDPAKNGSPLFAGHSSTNYDGFADLAFVAILSSAGKFGGVRTANAHYFASTGLTGVYAPGIEFTGPVYVGNIDAFEEAKPVLILGTADSDTLVTGGDLLQTNGQAVQVHGLRRLQFVDGTDSQGNLFPAQFNQAHLEQDGIDVTTTLVVNPP